MSKFNDSRFDSGSAASTAGCIILALASLVPPRFARADEIVNPDSANKPNATERIDQVSGNATTREMRQTAFTEIPAPRKSANVTHTALEIRALVGERLVAGIIPPGSLNIDKSDQLTYALELDARIATREENLAILHKLLERNPHPFHRDEEVEVLGRYENGSCVADNEGYLRIDEAGNVVALKEPSGHSHTALFITEEHRLYTETKELSAPKVATHQQVEAIEGHVTIGGESMRVVLTGASIGLSGRAMEEYATQLGGRLGTAQEHEAYLKDLLYKRIDGALTKAEEAALKMHEENWVAHEAQGPEAIRIKDGKLTRVNSFDLSHGSHAPMSLAQVREHTDLGAFIVIPPAK